MPAAENAEAAGRPEMMPTLPISAPPGTTTPPASAPAGAGRGETATTVAAIAEPGNAVGTSPDDTAETDTEDVAAESISPVSRYDGPEARTRAPETTEPDTVDVEPENDTAAAQFGPSTAPGERASAHGYLAAPMPAHVDEWERRLLADPDLLGDIAFAIGRPFHVMYPARVGGNIAAFREVFAAAGIDGAIYFGKKANKAGCVVRACAEHGAGADVASIGELSSALAQGIRGEDLMVTGPAKSDRLLWLAARHGALIAVDEPDELNRLVTGGIAARVLLRVRPPGSDSRFGMTDAELDHAVAGTQLVPIRLEGFSFHLSGYEPVPRSELAASLIERCLRARDYGHPASTISLGGGFGVDYVPADAWVRFTADGGPHWFHGGKRFDSYYPYHCPTPGALMLAAVLTHGGLAKQLRDNNIRPAIEPGRALLDRVGSTVFRVQGAKTRIAQDISYQLLTVDGTSLSLSEQWFASEYLPDPVPWPSRPGPVTGTVVGAATCLESDMLSWRRIPLPRPAVPGDLLVYPNTAGYQMDSNESAFHELPIPPKVVLHDAPDGRLRWTLDAG
ncbi:type III PLP-dependent enzyme domain-containing protein [Nocardia aurantia]|uniref:Y4yA family PLP-dependent enzyme n=1 Tax=Nocardia aurantia TaxID=2585199 RepID=UPI0029E8080B|nr:Y4yA family PLP-dependent enzyme [Nocardia aurantia]